MRLPTIQSRRTYRNQRVLVRLDLNVPLRGRKVIDDARLRASLPTLRLLRDRGATVIIIAHLGRPGGTPDKALSLAPIARQLGTLLRTKVSLLREPIGSEKLTHQVEQLTPGSIAMLENIRFYKAELSNDTAFAKQLAALGDAYVNDAFAVNHRKHTSLVALAKQLPAFAGLLVQDELGAMNHALTPKSPAVLVIGGMKIETKLPVIRHLLPRFDAVLVSGGVFNTILASQGHRIGDSAKDSSFYQEARWLAKQKKVWLPFDVTIGTPDGTHIRHVPIPKTRSVLAKKGLAIMDIGPATMKLYCEIIRSAKTIVWNGPLGFFEQSRYRLGTDAMAAAVGERAKAGAYVLVGGGETTEALHTHRMVQYITHVSTGGGAMLAYLSGKQLPALGALR